MRSRLYLRLMMVALLVLFLPVAGIWSLAAFEKELLAAEERAMAVQARSLAASLAEAGVLDATAARDLLAAIERPLAGRIRILAANATALADTATQTREPSKSDLGKGLRDRMLYRVGAFLWRLRNAIAPGEASEKSPSGDEEAIRTALAGGYGALTRRTADGTDTVLTVSVPIRGGSSVLGAVAVSRTTDTVLAALDRIRVDLFRTVLLSFVATGAIVLLLARGVVQPLVRLRDAADASLAHPTSPLPAFPGAERPDEIGDLARALGRLRDRLEGRLGELEAFASDVAHELRNPLATVRSAADLLRHPTTEEERERLATLVATEVRRIEEVLGALQELARLDAERLPEPALATDLREIAERVAIGYRESLGDRVAIDVRGAGEARVAVPPEGAARVVANLLDNAVSFSPSGSRIEIQIGRSEAEVELTVRDQGPGIPLEHRERIFDRFFTWRPGETKGGHLGLGLGIARAVTERYGGTLSLEPAQLSRGAGFRVRWPGSSGE